MICRMPLLLNVAIVAILGIVLPIGSHEKIRETYASPCGRMPSATQVLNFFEKGAFVRYNMASNQNSKETFRISEVRHFNLGEPLVGVKPVNHLASAFVCYCRNNPMGCCGQKPGSSEQPKALLFDFYVSEDTRGIHYYSMKPEKNLEVRFEYDLLSMLISVRWQSSTLFRQESFLENGTIRIEYLTAADRDVKKDEPLINQGGLRKIFTVEKRDSWYYNPELIPAEFKKKENFFCPY